MRDMTDEQIIETLATNRMHWHRGCGEWIKNAEGGSFMESIHYWYDKNQQHKAFYSSTVRWNPLENISDAFQLVDEMKRGEWNLTLEDKGDKWKAVFMDPEACFLAEAGTPQRAICLAILDYVA